VVVGEPQKSRLGPCSGPPNFRSFRLSGLLTLQTDPVADAFLPCAKGGRNQGHATSRTDRRALVIHV
jgi:hypothetical protein